MGKKYERKIALHSSPFTKFTRKALPGERLDISRKLI